MKKQRIIFIDLAKGICIILVVLYHINQEFGLLPTLFTSMTTFRIPLFFFLSGLFFKEYDGFPEFLKKKTNKLLIPFLSFYVITSFIIPNVMHQIGFTVAQTGSLGISGLWGFLAETRFANISIWFLWCLFTLNIIFYFIILFARYFKKNNVIVICLLSGLYGAIGMMSSLHNINIPAFVDTALSATPFFCLGFLMRHHSNLLFSKLRGKYLLPTAIICFAITYFFGGNCSYMENIYSINPFRVYLCGVAGIMGVVFFAKQIEYLPFVSYWGRYSIMILVTHGLLLKFVVPLIRRCGFSGFVAEILVLVVTMFSYNLIIPIMKKYLPYITAQKDLIPSNATIPHHVS